MSGATRVYQMMPFLLAGKASHGDGDGQGLALPQHGQSQFVAWVVWRTRKAFRALY